MTRNFRPALTYQQAQTLAVLLENSDIDPEITSAVKATLERARPEPQEPIRKDGGTHNDYVEQHPAYAMIGASRVSSMPGAPLFGSDFRHQHYVVISIRAAEMARGINHDWYHGLDEYIEVALSEAQWATFVSSMNVGDGVPATLVHLHGQRLPGIVNPTDRREQMGEEIDQRLQHALALIDELSGRIDGTTLSAKVKADLKEKARAARSEFSGNLAYVARQYDLHAEQTIERAKIEIGAYMTAAITRAGLQALAGGAPLLELQEGEPATND